MPSKRGEWGVNRARATAILALVLLAAGALGAVYDVIDDFPVALILIVALGLGLWVGWAGLLRTGAGRVARLVVAGALLAGVVATIAIAGVTLGDLLVLGCLAAAVAAARVAFVVHIPLARVPPPERPTLFVQSAIRGRQGRAVRVSPTQPGPVATRPSSSIPGDDLALLVARRRSPGERTGWPWPAATARRRSSPSGR